MDEQLKPEPGPQSGDETVERMQGLWSTLLAVFMHQQDIHHALIGPADIEAFAALGLAIMVRDGEGGDGKMHIRLMPLDEAARLKAADVLARTSKGQRP